MRREFHRVPGETGASPTKLEQVSASFTGYPVKLEPPLRNLSRSARVSRGAGEFHRVPGGVAVAPGIDFDTDVGNRFVRLSFPGRAAVIEEALERLSTAF